MDRNKLNQTFIVVMFICLLNTELPRNRVMLILNILLFILGFIGTILLCMFGIVDLLGIVGAHLLEDQVEKSPICTSLNLNTCMKIYKSRYSTKLNTVVNILLYVFGTVVITGKLNVLFGGI